VAEEAKQWEKLLEAYAPLAELEWQLVASIVETDPCWLMSCEPPEALVKACGPSLNEARLGMEWRIQLNKVWAKRLQIQFPHLFFVHYKKTDTAAYRPSLDVGLTTQDLLFMVSKRRTDISKIFDNELVSIPAYF